MNFLKKILGVRDKMTDSRQQKDPENTKLNYLLGIWAEHPSDTNYKAVMDEMLIGNTFLLLPSINDNETEGWNTIEAGKTLNLTSVFNLDGLKVLAAFSDERSLAEWSKESAQYIALPANNIIEICKGQGIDRIVINSGQKSMYVLERNRENITSKTIKQDTKVQVGTPANPLNKSIIDKLIENFKEISVIEEAYQYVQNVNGETSMVLGIKMSMVSDNARTALLNAVNNALSNEHLDLPVDIMILDTESWLSTVRNIQNALFYKR